MFQYLDMFLKTRVIYLLPSVDSRPTEVSLNVSKCGTHCFNIYRSHDNYWMPLVKVKVRSVPVENLLPRYVGSIINYLQ